MVSSSNGVGIFISVARLLVAIAIRALYNFRHTVTSGLRRLKVGPRGPIMSMCGFTTKNDHVGGIYLLFNTPGSPYHR